MCDCRVIEQSKGPFIKLSAIYIIIICLEEETRLQASIVAVVVVVDVIDAVAGAVVVDVVIFVV